MSKVVDLISQYCPNGVDMVKVIDLIDYLPGGALKRHEVLSEGAYPVMNGGISYSGYYNSYNFGPDVLTISHWGSSAGHVHAHKDLFWANNACWVFAQKNAGKILLKYLYYALKADEKEIMDKYAFGGATPNLSRDAFNNHQLPVPPIPVQKEIVRVLDSMTDLVDDIDQEIAEREKQYEHAREQLLTFGEGAENVKLNDVASHYTGLTYKPSDVRDSGTLVLRSSNIQNSHLAFDDNVYVEMANIPERALVKENDILICVRNGSSALIGKAALITKDVLGSAFGAFMTVLRAERIDYKYLFYVWQSKIVQHQIKGDGGAPINQITNREFDRISIPLPSLSVQQSIVEKLDACEELLQNLREERDLRQKQYEFYREQLLRF